MTRTLRAVASAAAVAVGAALAVVMPAGVAQAATTYTWTGSVSHDWGDAQNWSPQQVPGPGDTAQITSTIGTTTVSVTSPVTVQDLEVEETVYNLYLNGTGALSVTGDFEWTGGDISVPVTVAGSGRIGSGELKALTGGSSPSYHGSITVTGSLLLDAIGTDSDYGLDLYPDYQGDNDGIRISATGTLRAQGNNLVSGTGCCTDPARIVNQGTIEVTSGQTTFKAVEVDQLGIAKVAPNARLTQTTGPARLGAGASYHGGGTLEFIDTAKIAAYPNTDPVPGGVLMQGTGTLADKTRLLFGAGAKVTGVGGFTGPGLLDFDAAQNSAQQSATVYGDLSTGSATQVRFAGAHPARLSVWSPSLSGYHGVLRIGGSATLGSGKSFVPAGGTTTVVNKGGRLSLAPGSTWGGGDCCTQPARLAVSPGAILAVPAGSGSAAHLLRVDLRNSGTLDLAAGRVLATSGFPITLGGTLRVAGRTAPKATRTVITGSGIKGRFGCVSPGGQVATYSSTAVRLTGTLGSFSGCAKQMNKKLAAKTLKKRQKLKVRIKGVPKSAKKVLLAVTVTKPAKKAKLKVGGVVVKAPAKKKTTRYVVAKSSKGEVAVVNTTKKKLKVRVVLVGVPR